MTRGALAILTFLLALACVAGCSANGPSGSSSAGEWFAHAEAANQEADRRLVHGDTGGARNVLRDAVETEPPSSARIEDARVVRQDLLYRLASIDLGAGKVTAAVAWATQGLTLGRSNDAFTSNLLIVRGRAFERMNDVNGASRDYHDALLVTEVLLDQSLEGKAP
jgi:hypothetical protein